jgi:hypothetical protein
VSQELFHFVVADPVVFVAVEDRDKDVDVRE